MGLPSFLALKRPGKPSVSLVEPAGGTESTAEPADHPRLTPPPEPITDSEGRFQALFEATSQGITQVDPEERVLLANPAAERIFGVAPGGLVGRNLSEFLGPDDLLTVERETRRRIRGESGTYIVEIRRPDGAHRSLSVTASPMHDAAGGYRGASAFFLDVTEKQLNENALRQAQKLESMGVLAGGIAHDFNNLLSAIMGNLNLLQLETPTGSRSIQLLSTMEAAVNRAANLTRQMLAYSGRGRFQICDLNLNQTVRELSELFQVGISKGAGLHFDLAADLPLVVADPSQMQQLLMTLVTNASEALEGRHGQITVSTRVEVLDAMAANRASLHAPIKPGPHVVLQVRDDGVGIAPEVLPHIFDPFFTTKESGRGLGLSAMLGILRGHGAGIEINSRPGQGSTFTLFFPMAARVATEPRPRPAQPSRPFTGKVLAVDDEPAVLETVTIMLERLGFQVLVARDGIEALECFRANADGIGLVLLDLTMPRMDGKEAFLAIRRLKANLPMILSSGYDAQQTMNHLRGPGAPTFLQKPYTLKVLRKTIESALGA
jgi:PAS domain S-box-containing protein